MLPAGTLAFDPHGSRNPVAGGDGTGGIPKTTGPSTPTPPSKTNTSPIKTPTLGHVIDAFTRAPIVGALVVVTTAQGGIAGVAYTDEDGIFLVDLFAQPDLELAIPSEGLAGVPIQAGEALTIMVP